MVGQTLSWKWKNVLWKGAIFWKKTKHTDFSYFAPIAFEVLIVTHGNSDSQHAMATGCTLSSAIARICASNDLLQAVSLGQKNTYQSIEQRKMNCKIGRGQRTGKTIFNATANGPLNLATFLVPKSSIKITNNQG